MVILGGPSWSASGLVEPEDQLDRVLPAVAAHVRLVDHVLDEEQAPARAAAAGRRASPRGRGPRPDRSAGAPPWSVIRTPDRGRRRRAPGSSRAGRPGSRCRAPSRSSSPRPPPSPAASSRGARRDRAVATTAATRSMARRSLPSSLGTSNSTSCRAPRGSCDSAGTGRPGQRDHRDVVLLLAARPGVLAQVGEDEVDRARRRPGWSATAALSRGNPNITPAGSWASTTPSECSSSESPGARTVSFSS